LGRRGTLDRVELDTHFFKGNAPHAATVWALDAHDDEVTPQTLAGHEGWRLLVDRAALEPHRRHQLEVTAPMHATHLRVHIDPHGGVNRLRAFGHAVDTEAEKMAIDALHAMSDDDARALLLSFNGSNALASLVLTHKPKSVRALWAAMEHGWWSLDEAAWLEAFAAHPAIGSTHKAASATAQSASWSAGEQSRAQSTLDDVNERLAQGNEQYRAHFGFTYIVFATGKTAPEMLALLEQRLQSDRQTEVQAAAREQHKITKLRLEKWLRTFGA
jgi:allantoicase